MAYRKAQPSATVSLDMLRRLARSTGSATVNHSPQQTSITSTPSNGTIWIGHGQGTDTNTAGPGYPYPSLTMPFTQPNQKFWQTQPITLTKNGDEERGFVKAEAELLSLLLNGNVEVIGFVTSIDPATLEIALPYVASNQLLASYIQGYHLKVNQSQVVSYRALTTPQIRFYIEKTKIAYHTNNSDETIEEVMTAFDDFLKRQFKLRQFNDKA